MKTADPANLDMLTVWYENDRAMRITVNFPFYAAMGNQSSAVVYFEIEPGRYLLLLPSRARGASAPSWPRRFSPRTCQGKALLT